MDFDDDEEESVSSESGDNYIKPDSNPLPLRYVKEIADNFKEFKLETNKQIRKEYSKKNIKYVTNYMYNMLWKLDFQEIKKVTFNVCNESSKNDAFGLKGLSNEFLEFLELSLDFVYRLYSLKEIQIDETDILCGKNECADVRYDIDTIRQCLEKTDIILFVTINKTNFFCYNYSPVCCDRKDFILSINQQKINYSCLEGDSTIFIRLPIGPSGTNIYIPLLSALMILQSDKRIFYLLKQNVSYAYGFDETFQLKKCKDDVNSPIMYVAICGGSNCSKEEWTGGCVDHMEIYRTKLAEYMQEKKRKEEEEEDVNAKVISKKRKSSFQA